MLRGYGAYLAQNPDIAEDYRKYGATEGGRGNKYFFNGPDNDTLINSEAPISQQSEKVRTAFDRIIRNLQKINAIESKQDFIQGITNGKSYNDISGWDFYRGLAATLYDFWESRQTSQDIANKNQVKVSYQLASSFLNKHGIPGLRFLDKLSRGVDQAHRTYNFVIWNVDTLKLWGVEGDPEAVEYFNRTKAEQRKARLQDSGEDQSYGQPLNRDVDLDDKVNIVNISSTLPKVPFYERMKAFGKDQQQKILNKFGNGVVNEHTGLTITLSNQGLNHILSTARNREGETGNVIYQAIPYLDELAKAAYRVETHEDRKPSPTKLAGQLGNLKQVHRFLAPVNLDGEQHVLKLTAKEYDNGKTEVDEVSLYDMSHTKKIPVHFIQDSPNLMRRATGTTSDPGTISVREMLEGVNDVSGKPYLLEKNIKKIKSEGVTSDNGTQPEVGSPNAHSIDSSLAKASNSVNGNNDEGYNQALSEGETYRSTFESGKGGYLNAKNEGFKKITQLPEGSRFTAHYLQGGNSVFEVGNRGIRKTIVEIDEDGRRKGRLRVITTPATVRHILGNPYSITIDHIPANNYSWVNENVDTKYPDIAATLKKGLSFDPENVTPNYTRTASDKKSRSKHQAEIVTPIRLVKEMVEHIDKEMSATYGSWKNYARSTVIEPACGETPFITTRYDTETGKVLPISERVGVLDRKLKRVSEGARDQKDWARWAMEAVNSVFGFDLDGGNVLIARTNIVDTYADYLMNRWGRFPTNEELNELAEIVSHNYWQDDFRTAFETAKNMEQRKINREFLKSVPDSNNDEGYNQIAPRRKADMDKALQSRRPDMNEQQRADAISEIEKLGESTKAGGNPKVEKLATKWLLDGHIILPEDNYKILDAIKISEQQHFDPMQYNDPNEILAKYTIKPTRAELRINPDTVPEFKYKIKYNNGIAIYSVSDTKKGQKAVRSIIDTHWGKDANPWCLAARQDGKLSQAWKMWKHYSGTPKYIAFKDGKLIAFSASDTNKTKWWDREDNPTNGIPFTEKINGTIASYVYNISEDEILKTYEDTKDGFRRKFYDNGNIEYEYDKEHPFKIRREFYKNGQLKRDKRADGTETSYYEDGQIEFENSPDGSARSFYRTGKLRIDSTPNLDGNGTITWYYKNGDVIMTRGLYKNGFPKITEEDARILQEIAFKEMSEEDSYNQAMPSNNGETSSENETAAWNELVDRFVNHDLKGYHLSDTMPVMTTPPVFTLVGMEQLPMEIRLGNINKILNKKHHLNPETLKQIPQALADPIMIFKSELDPSKNRNSRVVLTELKETDKDGIERSIIAAITLGRENTKGEYLINELSTVYRKDTTSKQQLSPNEDILDKINRTFKDGSSMNLLMYINKQKSLQWSKSPGISPLAYDTIESVPDSIPNENDLARIAKGKSSEDNKKLLYTRSTSPVIDSDSDLAIHSGNIQGQRASGINARQSSNTDSLPEASTRVNSSNGFMTTDKIEAYNQAVTHATGHILEGNRFRLSKIGTGEGHQAYGHGIYFEQAPEVAEVYRKMGLPRKGIGDIKVITSKGQTFNFSDPNSVKKLTKSQREIIQKLDNIALGDYINGHKISLRSIKSELYAPIRSTIKDLQEILDGGLEAIKHMSPKSREYAGYQENIKRLQGIVKGLKDDLVFIRSISGIEKAPDKRGNVYNVDIAEDEDLFFWDETLDKQPGKAQSVLQEAIDTINNRPEAALAGRYSIFMKRNAVSKLQAILEKLSQKYKGHYIDQDERVEIPEYKAIKQLFTEKSMIEDLFNDINKMLKQAGSRNVGNNATGDRIYWDLTNTLGSAEAASKWLNDRGIYGHKYFDGQSREKGEGTYNFVIWNEDKMKVLGLTNDSDEDAKEYFERTSREQAQNAQDGESYNQAMSADNPLLNARRQFREVRKQYEGTDQWLKAPNGKKSNLNERQWLQVRTPNFKAWFGDWENDPKNASKVVDENGEPLVVYHGTWKGGFDEFDTAGEGKTNSTGAWFNSREDVAGSYTRGGYNPQIYATFLNIRNPYIFNAEGKAWNELGEAYIEDTVEGNTIYEDERGNPFTSWDNARDFVDWKRRNDWNEHTNDEDFDHDNEFFEDFENDRYEIVSSELETTDQIVRAVWAGEYDFENTSDTAYDGVIFKDIEDNGWGYCTFNGDDYIIPNSNQVKSATRNVGTFSNDTNNIYFQSMKDITVASSTAPMLNAQEQFREVRKQYKGTKQWLRAPNGKKSNLTERQWIQVRTPNFKAWFGDWENDPENASKILDENGEPLVVYHGTNRRGFSEFNTKGKDKTKGTGAWFTSIKEAGKTYGAKVYNTYLNIRNPYIHNANGRDWNSLGEVYINDANGTPIYHDENGNEFLSYDDAIDYLERNGMRDEKSNAGYNRYEVYADDKYGTTDKLVRGVWAGDFDDFNERGIPFDGVIIEDVVDYGPDYSGSSKNNDYIIPDPNQVKSATRNTGEFGNDTDNIYHQAIKFNEGEIDENELLDIVNKLTKNNEKYKKHTYIEEELRGVTTMPSEADIFNAQEQLDAVRKQYEGTKQWLRAPNGKKSKLNEKQWLQVRTPNFKRWFGDWENDPEHASKILDSNGEPLIVYRGVPENIDSLPGVLKSHNPTRPGIFFSSSKYSAKGYTFKDTEGFKTINHVKDNDPRIYQVYLNIRNPYVVEGKGKLWNDLEAKYGVIDDNTGNAVKDGFATYGEARKFTEDYIESLLGEEKVKILDDIFDKSGPLSAREREIQQEHADLNNRYSIKITQRPSKTDDILKEIVDGKRGKAPNGQAYDGVVFKDIYDNMMIPMARGALADVHVALGSKQVKSATKNTGNFGVNEDNIYNQSIGSTMTMRADASELNAQEQLDAVRKQYEGTKQWLRAPNGKKSNLNEKQWLQVRTPNFKRWFGDWENDPEHASKAIDENGEPLIVYHGTSRGGFDVFKTTGLEGTSTIDTGAYLTSKRKAAEYYMHGDNAALYEIFINVRNPYEFDAKGRYWAELGDVWIEDSKGSRITKKADGTPFLSSYEAEDYIRDVLDNNTKKYTVKHDEKHNTTDDIVRAVWRGELGNGNHDSVIFRNVCDPYEANDEFIIPKANQIKSATRNNGNFSLDDDSQYNQILGEKGARQLDEAEGVTTRMDNLSIAKRLKENPRISAKRMKMATGWELAPDGKWRYEVVDTGIDADEIIKRAKLGETYYLKDFWGKDNEVLKAYPELGETKIVVQKKRDRYDNASYIPSLNTIVINSNAKYVDRLKTVLVHEVQHAIQHIEGFAPGGHYKDFSKAYNNFQRRLNRIISKRLELDRKSGVTEQLWQTYTYDEYKNARDEELEEIYANKKRWRMASPYAEEYKKLDDKYNAIEQEWRNKHKGAYDPEEIYVQLGGEVEARNVKKRRNMNEEERRTTPLADTQDTDQWILPDENGEYNQILGEIGARTLDKREGNTFRMDALNMAKGMTNANVDPKTIKAVTNWELAPDGKWRFEIMDYDINEEKLHEALNNDDIPFKLELADLYNNEELYNAYPYMRRYSVLFTDLGKDTDSYYDEDEHLIAINTGMKEADIGIALIHEIQHAIQGIEGFVKGGTPDEFRFNTISLFNLNSELKMLKRLRKKTTNNAKQQNYDQRIANIEARIEEVKQNGLDGKVEVDGQLYDNTDDAYRHLGGEIEAYNVENRKDFTEKQRRDTLLSETQDYNDWLIRNKESLTGKTASQKRALYNDSNFMTEDDVQEYNQKIINVFEGTGHIIEGNEFKLDKIGTGEGGAAYAWGAYLAGKKAVAATYRKYGLDRKATFPGRLSVTDKQGKVHEFEVIDGTPNITDGEYSEATRLNLTNLARLMAQHPKSTFSAIKSRLKRYYKDRIKMASGGKELTQRMTESLKELEEGKFTEATLTNSEFKNGNIYKFAITDNDDLLDWDKPLNQQPEKVRDAINRIVRALSRYGIKKEAILGKPEGGDIFADNDSDIVTGGDIYDNITREMNYWIRHNAPNPLLFNKKVSDPKEAASRLLNKYGVVGTRFLDQFSRQKGKGSHNYVIWNMQRMKMTGITKDSDKDARDFFKNGGTPQYRLFDDNGEPMVYNQIAPRRKGEMDLALRKHRPDLSANQIKSATSNNGNFSLDDNNIYHQSLNPREYAITREDVDTIQAIPGKSINDFTSDEITKTDKWARKFWRELKTKSPYFRNWFGDWRAGDKSPIEVVKVTGTKEDMQKGTYKNNDTGWDILVSKRVYDETWNHSKRRQPTIVDAIGNVDDIIKNAVLLDTKTRQLPKSEIQAANKINMAFMHDLYAIIEDKDGNSFLVDLMVDELYNEYNSDTFRRAYELRGITKTPLAADRYTSKDGVYTYARSNGVGLTVADLFQAVKENDPNFKPKEASKVVDENGRPLPVYHGTAHKGFSVFNTEDGVSGLRGAWFTDSLETSDSFTHGYYDEGTYTVFLNIKNPLIFDYEGTGAYDEHNGLQEPNYYLTYSDDEYDGVIAKNIKDRGGYLGGAAEQDEDGNFINFYEDTVYGVKNPEQIKSLDNRGTFNSGNPDIYYQTMRADASELNTKEQLDAVRAQYAGTKQWLKAPNGKKSNLNELQWLQVRTENFKRMFGDWENDPEHSTKVLDENGEPKVVYHGTSRPDRIGDTFRADRATSGPMAFFTDDPEIASRYATDKNDTSLSRDAYDYRDQFTVSVKWGRGKPEVVNIKNYWHYLTQEQRDNIAKIAPTIGYNDEYEIEAIPGNTTGSGGYALHIREARGNHLEALVREWLDSANLLNNEREFLKVLKLVGVNNVQYADPNAKYPGVYPVFLDIKKPFITTEISDKVLNLLKRTAEREQGKYDPRNAYDSDAWDKTNIEPMEWLERLEDDIANDTTHAWTQIPDWVTRTLKRQGYDGIQDTGGKYHATAHNVYIPFKDTQVKSAIANTGEFNNRKKAIYAQALNPKQSFSEWLNSKSEEERKYLPISSIEPARNAPVSFESKEIEQRYTGGQKDIENVNVLIRVMRSNLKLLKSFRSPLSKLSSKKDLLPAKAMLEQLGRKRGAQVHFAMKTFTENLKGLNDRQLDIFGRKRLLDDLMWRKQQYPEAKLPFGFDNATLIKEYQRFTAMIEANPAVKRAIQLEERTIANISREFAGLAKELGLNLDNTFRNPHYYRHQILEYANAANAGTRTSRHYGTLQDIADKELNAIRGRGFLKHYKGSDKDINTDYIMANAEVRQQMLMDIEAMKTLIEIKKKYDIAPRLRNKIKTALKQGDAANLTALIPEGYSIYNPAGSRLIQSANTATENVIAMALDDASEESGLPLDELLNTIGQNDEEFAQSLWVVPTEVKETLREMGRGRDRGMLWNIARAITRGWKYWTLFNPFRNLKYNFRNFTGDLDAIIAGNPGALRYFGRSFRELTDFYLHGEATDDLIDFIERSGKLSINSMGISSLRSEELEGLADDVSSRDWHSLPRQSWNLIKRFFDHEVAFTEWRENLLRYAAYLAYKEDMDNNNGAPITLGASNEDEIMSLSDVKDRAFKMSNELLGDYDNISEFGKITREIAVPFWSWNEVNAKRYYRIIRNGLRGDNASDFMVGPLLAVQAAKVPFYALTAAETFGKIALLTILIQAFNRLVHGDDDDELPEDVKYRPHLTFGKVGGRIYYFDRIGALADVADWVNLDSIYLDAKQMANGQMSLGQYMKKVIKAPVSKGINALNPFIKMPFEIATGKTFYPYAFNAGNIRDYGKYFASTLGLNWPYKAITGEPRNDWDELSNLLLYSVDPDEAAYWQTRDKVRQFQTRVLGRSFNGFATSPRSEVLRKLKSAMRYNDKAAIQRYMQEYKRLEGTDKGFKASMRAMDPLWGLSKDDQKRFMRWINDDDRKYLQKAQRYYRRMAGKYVK